MSLALSCIIVATSSIPAYATKTDELQNQIDNLEDEIDDINDKKKEAEREKKDAESQLSGVNGEISSISGAMGDLGEEIEGINAELVGVLTAIDLIEEDIANKEQEIIDTQAEYEAAVEEQNNQYESMKIRIKYMYEQGDSTYLSILLEAASNSFSDALNKAEYVDQLYTYDRLMLEKYMAQVEYTKEVWDRLEEEKSELETSKEELQEEQAYLEELEAQLQEEYDNYGVMLAQAKKQAAAYTAKINQQTNEIKQLEREEKAKKAEAEKKKKEKEAEEERIRKEEEEKRKKEEGGNTDDDTDDNGNDGNKGSSDDNKKKDPDPPPTASGSGSGSKIANYALQFVGNPYVPGGTSLTNGADCSGFVQSVYKAFGYSLPRTSYSQSTVGTAVSYSQAQPGDIIYYGGHVGIYIGNGQIVHASTQRTGIKVSPATYRSIITIRRVVK